MIDDTDAAAVVGETLLTERELLVKSADQLVERGLHKDLVTPLRRRWVGSPRPITVRWYRALGMAAVATVPEFNNVLGGHESLIEERLRMARVSFAPPGSAPRSQYRLAESVFTRSFEIGIEENAKVHGIRAQEVVLYRRRFARMLAETEVLRVAPEDRPGFWYDAWALRPEFLRKTWTTSPVGMWQLLAGSKG